MPVGELVATIDCNDSQALSDDNIDELRSACHDAAVLLDGECPSTEPKVGDHNAKEGLRQGSALPSYTRLRRFSHSGCVFRPVGRW